MAKKETMKQFEKSSVDRRQDKAGAKKMSIPVGKYEGSPKDLKEDMKTLKAINKKKMRV